ncbi:MAG: hypothetical protein C4541_11965 [Candidatus Auribacter fodinae]|uniref:PEP-CTERM sorting domain-containing protein n=1 Tax=Candidatus Auribacter fodinae TaxID=2093366 RepID=A0A3A4QR97_9BACT|nr:MAG: hypothetical protein C4541_11965 [Candidatus Auribacter fodinae]
MKLFIISAVFYLICTPNVCNATIMSEYLAPNTDLSEEYIVLAEAEGNASGKKQNYQFNISLDYPNSSGQQTNYSWKNGVPTSLHLQYVTDINQNYIALSFGIQTLTYYVTGDVTDIFIQAESDKNRRGVIIDDISVDGESINKSVEAQNNKTSDILHLSSAYFLDGFDLHCKATMFWPYSQKYPNSTLSFRISLATVDNIQQTMPPSEGSEGVPEQQTIILLICAIIFYVSLYRKKRLSRLLRPALAQRK